MTVAAPRWWGWGTLDVAPGDFPPELVEFLADRLRGPFRSAPPAPLEAVSLPAPRPCAVAPVAASTDLLARLTHAAGKSTRDLLALRAGRPERAPDAVAYPESAEEVAAVLARAALHPFAVIPFGGGTSVVGGVEPFGRERHTAVVALDLARLNRLVSIDYDSRTAVLQAGMRGPEVEAALGAQGFTLGHFPQSFEFSTLGGWIATRSAGDLSTRYGRIEDMVRAVRVITPAGQIHDRPIPARAAGPEWLHLLIGSEGRFGVIVEATVRILPKPKRRRFASYLFETFGQGIDAVQAILHNGLRPALVRLSDRLETRFAFRLAGAYRRFGFRLLERFRPRHARGAHLLLGAQDTDFAALRDLDAAREVASRHDGVSIGSAAGEHWLATRFRLPYLRDALLDRGVFVETYETAAPWNHLKALRHDITSALSGAVRAAGHEPLILAHLSHAYPDGASLYFTLLSLTREGEELPLWTAAKRAACEAILEGGGTLSHHHGIGMDHTPWLARERGPLYGPVLRDIRRRLDPAGVLNPGKLLP